MKKIMSILTVLVVGILVLSGVGMAGMTTVTYNKTAYDSVLAPLDELCHPVLNGTLGDNGWYVSNVTVSFVYDPEKVAAVYYILDGAEPTMYTELFEVCEDKEHYICWYYIDYYGNYSGAECINFKIDQTPPELNLTWHEFEKEDDYDRFIKFIIPCNDKTSSIDRVEFGIEFETQYMDYEFPYEWIIEWVPILGNPALTFTAFDKAGNSAFDTIKCYELIDLDMVVHVKEIYGTVDDPQYRPLANVTVEIKTVFPFWRGKTDESGTTAEVIVSHSIKYKVMVSKDGYHTYGCLPYEIVKTTDTWTSDIRRYDVYFTMAEDGSPFVQQISQSSQQSFNNQNLPSSQLLFQQMVSKEPPRPLGPLLQFWIVAHIGGYLINVEEINYSSSKKIGKYYIYRDVEIIGESEEPYPWCIPSLYIGKYVFYAPVGLVKLNVKLLINTGALELVGGELWFYAIGLQIKVTNL
jgi:hypothetical protein